MASIQRIGLILSFLFVWQAVSAEVIDYFHWPPCTRDQTRNCDITWSDELGRTYTCDLSSAYNETRCIHTLQQSANIGTLEVFGNEFLPFKLKAFRLIVPTMHTFILRDTEYPSELSHILRFVPEVSTVRLFRNKILTEYNGQSVPTQIKTLTGARITSDVFNLDKYGLHRLETFEVIAAPSVDHKFNFFYGGELIDLNYTNAQISSFQWEDIRIGLRKIEKLTLNFPNAVSLEGTIPFRSVQEVRLTAGKAIYDDSFMTPQPDLLKPLTFLELANVTFNDTIQFTGLDNLQELVLKQVSGVDKVTKFPENVSVITIIDSSIKSLSPSSWNSLKNLKKLTITRSGLRVVNEKFFSLCPNLEQLDLSNNELLQFSLAERTLMKMTSLDLSRNRLSAISHTLVDKPRVVSIDLTNNDLNSVELPDKDFLKCGSKLVTMDLTGSNMPCSCDISIFCAMLNKNTDVKGSCSRPNQLPQKLCSGDFSLCVPTVLSRTGRSLQTELEEIGNLSQTVNTATEFSDQEAHDALVKLSENNQLETDSKNSLRANYGVGFLFRGRLHGSVEKFKLHVNIYWKSFILPKFEWNLSSFQKLCEHSDDLIKAICQDFVPLVQQATAKVNLYSKQLKKKLTRLSSLIRDDIVRYEAESGRSRRDIPEVLRSLVSNDNSTLMKDTNETFTIELDSEKWGEQNHATKLYTGFLPHYGAIRAINQQQDRNKAMVSAIQTMATRQNLMKDAYIELKDDLSMAITLVADNFENTTQNIRMIHRMINDTNFEIMNIFGEVSSALNVLQQKVHGIRILSVLTTKYLDLWAKQIHNYFLLNVEADRLIDAVSDLSVGKLSSYLLPPDKLTEIIERVSTSLSAWHKDYVLVYTRLSQYYHHSDILYLPTARGVMLQLLWPVQPRVSQKYDLFLVSSVHMPAVTTPKFVDAESNHDFSRIELPRKYLGVSESNFVELDLEELDKCPIVDDSYFCYQVLFELDRSKLSCLSALYLNATADEIGNLCPVNYYFSPFSPEPSIIDAGSQLLVSGLTLPWTQRCLGDRIPRKTEGSLYSIVERDSLCFCSVDSPNGFLAKRITGCDHLNADARQPSIKLSYALNSLVIANFKEELNITGDEIYGEAPAEFTLPPFTAAKTVSEARFMNMSSGIIKLRALSELVKQKGDDFKSEWDEISAFLSFGSLFSRKYWFRAVSFIGSIAGFISLIAIVYMFCKTRYQQGFIQSLMFAHGAKAMNIDEICGDGKLQIELAGRSLIYLVLAHVGLILLIMLIIFSGKRLISLFCRESKVLADHPTLRKHPEVEIFLELHAGCEKVLLYILTVQAHFSKIELKGHMTPRSLVFDNHSMYGILRPDWQRENCKIVVDNIEIDLPAMIQVPLYKKRKVQSILKNVFTCSVLATDGLYLYKIGDRKHEVVADKSLNPYSSLIAELREREKAFDTNPISSGSMVQTAEIEMMPTAPTDLTMNLGNRTRFND